MNDVDAKNLLVASQKNQRQLSWLDGSYKSFLVFGSGISVEVWVTAIRNQ
jgi:hypothetical protein